MRSNRSQIFARSMLLLGLCVVVILSGCATMRGEKEADPGAESENQIESQAAAHEDSTGSSRKAEPIANSGGSGEQSTGRGSNRIGETDSFKHFTASLKEGLERILPGRMQALNWNKMSTVVGGIVVLSLIYGLAFGLGRLPLRRSRAGLRVGGRNSGKQAGGSAAQ